MIGSRLSVVGSSGSGKTTVASELARRLGLVHIELDAIHWGPDWQEASALELRRRIEPQLEGDRWVVDGNYGGKARDLVWSHADTVVWLDLPRRNVMVALGRRTVRRIVRREELWNGNRERLRNLFTLDDHDNLLVWTWKHFSRYRSVYEAAMTDPGLDHLEFVRLRSRRQISEFVELVTPR